MPLWASVLYIAPLMCKFIDVEGMKVDTYDIKLIRMIEVDMYILKIDTYDIKLIRMIKS